MSAAWIMEALLLGLIGIGGGMAVGGGMVAFLVVLDVIPRLAQIAKSPHRVHSLEAAVVSGALFFTLADFMNGSFRLAPLAAIAIGLLSGCFVGMLAGALTEVLNVFPIMAKRLGIGDYIIWLLMAMVFGKVAGSLFDFVWYWK
ncbi:stage V sporulation protein AB [Paenibacillus koleovorans]|uniref:stage V sporulation protein AB n=1 Tax=Paenibacillus koleovorans TaxID=121608 RepID=UPI001FE38FC6|nr:stage V sporulation protein AB [Paenibacillus koleovorans]